MKLIVLFIFLLGIATFLPAREIPADSVLLVALQTYVEGLDDSIFCSESETDRSVPMKVAIANKDTVTLNSKFYVLASNSAENGYLHGHVFGCTYFFFFQEKNGVWTVVDAMLQQETSPSGGNTYFKIFDIGKNKKAIETSWGDCGNRSCYFGTDISLLEVGKTQFLYSFEREYDNSAWEITDDPSQPCGAYAYETSYEVIKNDGEWYDLKIVKKEYAFTNGCEERKTNALTIEYVSYRNGKYQSPAK